MICPYITNVYTNQDNNLSDEVDIVDNIRITQIEIPMKCREEGCAVFDKKDWRCRYNG